MIEATVDEMYREDDANRFLEVTYQNGDKEILYYKDFASGAMIENIVRRAKKLAIKRVIGGGERGVRHRRPAGLDQAGVQGARGPARTRPTPTTGRRSRARRASASCSSAPSSTRAARTTPRAAGPSSASPPASTSDRLTGEPASSSEVPVLGMRTSLGSTHGAAEGVRDRDRVRHRRARGGQQPGLGVVAADQRLRRRHDEPPARPRRVGLRRRAARPTTPAASRSTTSWRRRSRPRSSTPC